MAIARSFLTPNPDTMETTTPAMENETVNMAALPGKKALAMLRRVMRVIQKGKGKPLPVRFEFGDNALTLTAQRQLKAASQMQVSVRAVVETAGQTAFVACMRSCANTLAEETPSELFVEHTQGSDARFVLDTETVHGPKPSIIYCPAPLAETDPDDVRARFQLDGQTVKDIITRMAWMASKDEMRPSLQGVCLRVAPDAITLVVTDGHVMQKREASVDTEISDGPVEVIIPAEALAILKAYMVRGESDVEVTVSDQRTVWTFANKDYKTTVAITNVEDKYPNYRGILDGIQYYPETGVGITFDPADMLEVAKVHKREAQWRVNSGAEDIQVGFSVLPESVTPYHGDGGEVGAVLPAQVSMPDLERMYRDDGSFRIGFNAHYVSNLMSATFAGMDSVTFLMVSPNQAALIETENATTVIMPLMLGH